MTLIDIQPDLPPYEIVSACDQIDLIHPADRPWRRGLGDCCGIPVEWQSCEFTTGERVRLYRIGQCPTCLTVLFEGGE